MESRIRNSVLLSIFVAVGAFFWLTGQIDRREPDQAALTAFLGTWTDENGPPGNFVRFSLVNRPSGLPSIQLSEGQGRIHGLLGENSAPIIWNYESHTPVRLNFIVGNRALVVPVRLVDPEHLHLRFVPTADVQVWSTNQVWDSPEVVRLARIKDAAEGP